MAVSLYHTHFMLPLQLPGISKFLVLYKLLLLFPAQISRNETLELKEKEKQMLAERGRKMHCLYNPSLSGTITISSIKHFFSIKPLTKNADLKYSLGLNHTKSNLKDTILQIFSEGNEKKINYKLCKIQILHLKIQTSL